MGVVEGDQVRTQPNGDRAVVERPEMLGSGHLLAARQDETSLADLAVEKVHRRVAEDPGDGLRSGVVVGLDRRADLQDPALVHHRSAAAERQCLDRLARRVDDDGVAFTEDAIELAA